MCSLREKSPRNWSQSRSALKEPLLHPRGRPPVDLSSGFLSTSHISREEIQMLQTLNLLWPLGPVSDELPASYVHMQERRNMRSSLAFMSLLTIQGRIPDFLIPIVLMTRTLETLHLPGLLTTTGSTSFCRSARSFGEQWNSPSMISFDTFILSFMEAFFLGGRGQIYLELETWDGIAHPEGS